MWLWWVCRVWRCVWCGAGGGEEAGGAGATTGSGSRGSKGPAGDDGSSGADADYGDIGLTEDGPCSTKRLLALWAICNQQKLAVIFRKPVRSCLLGCGYVFMCVTVCMCVWREVWASVDTRYELGWPAASAVCCIVKCAVGAVASSSRRCLGCVVR